jgi:hypothetical protein
MQSAGIPTGGTVYILARNDTTGGPYPSNDQLATFFMGGSLTATQQSQIAARINAFMTALGINVY